MRLSSEERQVIRESIIREDPGARMFVFGSRTDDQARGGDIDLLCVSRAIGRVERRRIKRRLCDRLGEQKIDLVVVADESSPFVRMILPDAVPMV